METLAALASLAPYGIGPAIAGYGAYRGARAFGKSALRSLPPRRRVRVSRPLRVKGVHTFRRTVLRNLSYIPLSGLNDTVNTGQSATFAFSLQDVRSYINAGSGATAVPNSSEFTNLFDCWRIKSVKCSVYFQDNTSTTSVNTTNMPLMNYVWDPEDRAVEAITDLLQHPGVKRYQFGNGAAKGGCLVTYGKPAAEMSGVVTTSTTTATRQNARSTWYQTTSPSVEYNSLKIVMDPIGATLATSEGVFSFYFDITYELKGVI